MSASYFCCTLYGSYPILACYSILFYATIYRVFYALINCYVGVYEYNDMDMYHTAKKEILQIINLLV